MRRTPSKQFEGERNEHDKELTGTMDSQWKQHNGSLADRWSNDGRGGHRRLLCVRARQLVCGCVQWNVAEKTRSDMIRFLLHFR